MDRCEIAGRVMVRSHADFKRACQRLVENELRKASPDNTLISVLCDAVRLSRECSDMAMIPLREGKK